MSTTTDGWQVKGLTLPAPYPAIDGSSVRYRADRGRRWGYLFVHKAPRGKVPPVGTDMPASKTNGFPIALDSAFNRIVRYSVAANLFEMNEVLAHLPYIISNGLEIELEVCEEVHRYDLDAKRAYYFQLEGERLHIWSWKKWKIT